MTNIMTLPLTTALEGHTQGENYNHVHMHAHKQQEHLGRFESFANAQYFHTKKPWCFNALCLTEPIINISSFAFGHLKHPEQVISGENLMVSK